MIEVTIKTGEGYEIAWINPSYIIAFIAIDVADGASHHVFTQVVLVNGLTYVVAEKPFEFSSRLP